MTNIPKGLLGLNHVALNVKNLSACKEFYANLIGMEIVWEPDTENVYLSSGTDNLALHQAKGEFVTGVQQHLDHLGFALAEKNDVDTWHEHLKQHNVDIKAPPKDHRDGARSFYCADPDGNIVQMIWLG